MLAAGFSPEECRQIRRLSDDDLAEDLLRAARDGCPVEAAWVLTREQLAALDKLVGGLPTDQLHARLAKLPIGIRYRDVQLYLLSRGLAEQNG